MAFTDGNCMSPADIAAVTGNNQNGWGGFGGDGAWWLLVLFLFAFNGNGFGNGWGGNGMMPYMMSNNTNNDVQRGFDQQALMAGIGGVTSAIGNLGTAMNAGFANSETAANARQIADMQQNFAFQTAMNSQLGAISMAQQNCCCENRAAILDSKYANAQEHCQDRYEAANNTRDLLVQGTANTQTIVNTMTQGFQAIQDKLCQQEIDALKSQNLALQNQLNMANFAASQNAQTAALKADNSAQTLALEQYLNPTAIPAYIVQNPNCCSGYNYRPCGCGA